MYTYLSLSLSVHLCTYVFVHTRHLPTIRTAKKNKILAGLVASGQSPGPTFGPFHIWKIGRGV